MEGRWIACGSCEAPWVLGSFDAQDAQDASIDICGLGFFELYLNGRKVSGDVLTPVWSDYAPRRGQRLKYPLQDERASRVYYRHYDLLPYLQEGTNTLQVLLGNGWFNQRMRNVEGDMWYGDRPQLWFSLRWRDGQGCGHCYASGEQLRWRPSHIVSNNVYFGEKQDFRVQAEEWLPVEPAEAPEGELCRQDCPADRVIREIQPVLLGTVDGRKVYDAGENITGWVRFVQRGAAGEETILRHAEELNDDGSLDFTSCGGLKQIQQDSYVSAGETAGCAPHFTWHGFRYFDVQGPGEYFTVQVVHSDVAVTGSFRCSDETINWLMDSYLRSRLGNMHCGVPSDCPHRERLGYTGDGQACADTDMLLLDADAFYRKWIQDIADGQCRVSGHVQHTAPFYGGGGGPGGWGGAMVLVPWAHYQRYQDPELLKKYYPNMLHWARYMRSRMDERGLVVREEPRGWCLGDWCAPEPVVIPEPYVNTCLLARCLAIITQIAALLGEDASEAESWLQEARQALRQQYYDEQTGHYAQGIQGADALALEAGLGDEALAARMAAHYTEKPWFDTGFLATGSVIRQLMRWGYTDTALQLLMSSEPGHSFGWQRQQGATTLWERWDGRESRNHPMFGGCIAGMLEGLVGIDARETLVLTPHPSHLLAWASSSLETRLGRVDVAWRWAGDTLRLKLNLPCRAELHLWGERIPLAAGEQEIARAPENQEENV